VLVIELDWLLRDVHLIAGLMAQRVPFVVAELGADVDLLMLHIYAALAEKERRTISRADARGTRGQERAGALLGNRTNLAEAGGSRHHRKRSASRRTLRSLSSRSGLAAMLSI